MSARRLAVAMALALVLPAPALGDVGGRPVDPDVLRARWAADYATAQAAAREAQTLLEAGRFDAARDALNAAGEGCDTGAEGRSCRLLVSFNLTYVTEREADVAVGDDVRRGLLRRSAAAYRAVLEEAPTNAATLNNLALVLFRLGDVGELVQLYRQWSQVLPAQAAEVAILAGDLRPRRPGTAAAAFDDYRRAADLAPLSEVARLKMVDAYRLLPPDAGEPLFEAASDWDLRFPQAAAKAYAAIVARQAGRDVAEPALLRWIDLVTRDRSIDPGRVAALAKVADYAPLAGLQRFIAALARPRLSADDDPTVFAKFDEVVRFLERRPVAVEWWNETEERRSALGKVALALGRQAIVAGAPHVAERRFLFGRAVTPEFDWYLYGTNVDHGLVPLDLTTELAWLSFRYPESDPNERKFNLHIIQLFEFKAEAYKSRLLAAIQRHHVVLGEIFAAKGVWEGGGAANAVFQLSRAVDMQNRRYAEHGVYETLAGVKEQLARAYIERERSDPGLARDVYLDAAAAYLDGDEPARAHEMIAAARGLRRGGETRAEALEYVADFRQAVLDELAKPRAAPSDAVALPAFVARALDADFVSRQSFKIAADQARIAERAGNAVAADILAGSAVDRARDLPALVGAGDLVRIEHVGSIIHPGMRGAPPVALARQRLEIPGTETWSLTLPSSDTPVFATLYGPREAATIVCKGC